MKKLLLFSFILFTTLSSLAQKVRPPINDRFPGRENEKQFAVKLFEHANYTGSIRNYNIGSYRLNDFNDVISSIRVAPGYGVQIFEHADAVGGYGIMADLLEDCPDLSVYGFNDKISHVNVFSLSGRQGHVWVRGQNSNGQYVPGHWERQRASGSKPANPNFATVSPPLPPNINGVPKVATVLQWNGPNTNITTLGSVDEVGIYKLSLANKQLGIIGNDFRGPEEIGTACTERESTSAFIPNNINFWYPQRPPNDHRTMRKHTLVGMVKKAKQVKIEDTYPDYDVNVDISPDPDYMYLLRDATPRKYTTIMNLQWQASKVSVGNILTSPVWNWEGSSGMEDCDDEDEAFTRLEAEIAPDYWPQGDHKFGRASFSDMALIRVGRKMACYGVWIWDEGHCRQPEIHPAEQFWWSDPLGSGTKYSMNVFCDASKRFWWRSQMDDGTKIHPWAAPPIKGLFAMAFDVPLTADGAEAAYFTKRFEVSNKDHYNVIEYPNANQIYTLTYQGRTLVSFKPNNNAFKVSFEHVGLDPTTNSVKGFLVIETSVGKVTQVATTALIPAGTNVVRINIGPNADPDKIDEAYEKFFFRKEDGKYLFDVIQTTEKVRTSGGVIR